MRHIVAISESEMYASNNDSCGLDNERLLRFNLIPMCVFSYSADLHSLQSL